METVESLQDIPNLSGQIELVSRKPYFNGQYSTVYHGEFGGEFVSDLTFALQNHHAL
jgi:hypothetical protein